MRVRLKGINSNNKRLADGRRVTYRYAWKGGPPLLGEPGSPEFIASYNEAIASKVKPPVGTMMTLLRYYENTGDFDNLAERTKSDYRKKIVLIERESAIFRWLHWLTHARVAYSRNGETNSPGNRDGKPTTLGRCWPGFCRLPRTGERLP
jgi:hypothetical protein